MGVSAFLVDATTPGVSVSPHLEKMGLRSSPMAEVVLDDVLVPAPALLGREGRGVAVFSYSMEWERGCILACCVGAMQRQLEECVGYARQRKQFGEAIGKYQAVAHRIVEMKVRYENARSLIYQVARKKDRAENAELEAAMAKLYVSEAFVASSLDAVRIHGGAGYMSELPYERQLRDAVGSLLYSGTSDIQRNIVARKLGL
jgi:alkylation response protein AidB-like acyl-CoA dehydrogenase